MHYPRAQGGPQHWRGEARCVIEVEEAGAHPEAQVKPRQAVAAFADGVLRRGELPGEADTESVLLPPRQLEGAAV